ncbi:MAG: DevR family CRISPR-associated autoregulator [Chloroflexi bacterium]|nr:DevR family CRISPR-associated autoregulator [Chloroflexota bacterium]
MTQSSETAAHPVTGISIAARLSLAAHALNNEGSRNNALIPRQIDVLHDGQIVQTNAVSGDSIKHTFVDHLRSLALHAGANGDGAALPLCSACRRGSPNRLNEDPTFQDMAKDSKASNEDVLDALIRRCVIDDVAGLLVTLGNRNAPRRSTAQFGWMVGRPEAVRTGRYIHLKLVPGAPAAESQQGSNLGQNLFTRPASSGQYAFVATVDLARIGVNDVSWQPAVPDETRRRRARAAIEALFRTVSNLEGAQRNTQLPHLEGAEGAVCVSRSTLPPILHSPLAEDFAEQMELVAAAFDRGGTDLAVHRFSSVAELGTILTDLTGGLLVAAG